MKKLMPYALMLALASMPLAAAPEAGAAATEKTELEAELREELSSLRLPAAETRGHAGLDPGRVSSRGAAVRVCRTRSHLGGDSRHSAKHRDVRQREAAMDRSERPSATPSRVRRCRSASRAAGASRSRSRDCWDTYYTHNTNSPEDGTNTLYYTNPNSRGFGLNQAKLEIDASGDGPIGFRSDIWFGSGARLFRDGLEPGPLEDVIYLQQAYGYYQFDNGAELDVGLFGTIAGLEVAESHLNWNYTRGMLWAWNEPFSHLGAKFSAPVSDTVTATFMLVNGFDNAWDQNSGKSYGAQISLAPSERFNTTATWINGPENWGTNDGWLKNFSWNFYGGLHDRFEVMGNLDYISNTDPDGVSATSWGMGGYARVHLSDQARLAYRFEFMDDSQARSTGIEQNLREYTITFEVQPVSDDPRFLTRFEFRRDWSDVAFFSCASCTDGFAFNQNTITVGLMWVFGPKE